MSEPVMANRFRAGGVVAGCATVVGTEFLTTDVGGGAV